VYNIQTRGKTLWKKLGGWEHVRGRGRYKRARVGAVKTRFFFLGWFHLFKFWDAGRYTISFLPQKKNRPSLKSTKKLQLGTGVWVWLIKESWAAPSSKFYLVFMVGNQILGTRPLYLILKVWVWGGNLLAKKGPVQGPGSFGICISKQGPNVRCHFFMKPQGARDIQLWSVVLRFNHCLIFPHRFID